MASEALRQAVYARFLASPVLVGLGLNADTIAPNFSPDAPIGDRFLIIRWGVTNRGIGRVNKVSVGCWMYNRQPDFGPIMKALMEIRTILPAMVGVINSNEAILSVDYGGDSDDLYDDGYRAHTRWTSHTIVASGS
jgi:hypothetical protein